MKKMKYAILGWDTFYPRGGLRDVLCYAPTLQDAKDVASLIDLEHLQIVNVEKFSVSYEIHQSKHYQNDELDDTI
jgi:hypothetical protein